MDDGGAVAAVIGSQKVTELINLQHRAHDQCETKSSLKKREKENERRKVFKVENGFSSFLKICCFLSILS